jgi:2-phosphosulfolactate phosphatase
VRKIDVCLSPDLLGLYKLEDKIVVVVDVLRATSCMVTALANGVTEIKTFSNAACCLEMRSQGYTVAGERNGRTLNGFDLGNSPLSYFNKEYAGHKIAMTTTNGTIAIEKSKHAKEVVIGAFLNLESLAEYLKAKDEDIVILCAGWKGKVNLEDTLFAGALTYELRDVCVKECDGPQLAETTYLAAKNNLQDYMSTSSHVKRLHRLHIKKDIDFCLQPNQFDIVPVFKDGSIVEHYHRYEI